ncbi:hypothetical protein J7L06_00935 [Candidatus Bathyarchaeota archaeon]|nr:hypothetical protein [Candidatus Bathyarchaeota archaeon]
MGVDNFSIEHLRSPSSFLDSSLAKPLLVGISIRLLLAPFLGHPYDLRIFMAVGWAVANGITPYGRYTLQRIFVSMHHEHLFGSFYGIGYPPPWGLILGSMYLLSHTLFQNSLYMYVSTLKLPIIAGDVATSLLLVKILRSELNVKEAVKAFNFYQFCPFILIVGAVWGMFDVLVFAFSILSAYLLFSRGELSAASLAVAASLKPYAIILAPLYSIFIYKKSRSIGRALSYLLSVLSLLALLTFLPMLVFKWPLSNLYCALSAQLAPTNFYYDNGNDYTYGAASPFNLFNVLRLIDTRIKPPSFLNYLWIGACLTTYTYSLFTVSDTSFKSIVDYSFLASLAFFTTRSWVSEQNLLFLLSFFMLSVLLNRMRDGWRLIHAIWVLFFIFVLVHVPAISFLWIVYPWTLNAATAFCNGPFGYTRWVAMTVLCFAWLALLWRYVFRRWKRGENSDYAVA